VRSNGLLCDGWCETRCERTFCTTGGVSTGAATANELEGAIQVCNLKSSLLASPYISFREGESEEGFVRLSSSNPSEDDSSSAAEVRIEVSVSSRTGEEGIVVREEGTN